MKLREAWKLSRLPYMELAYRSVQSTTGQASGVESNLVKRFNAIRRSAQLNKVAFAFFGTIGTAIPFLGEYFEPSPESLVSAVSLSLAISLAYVVFYSLQILPTFSNGEPYSILGTLPLGERDFSIVAMFSFLRTFDLLAISTGVFQVVAIFYFTGSPLATILMAVAALINIIFATAIALWLSGLFYRTVTRGGRTKTAAFGRLVFLLVWGFAAMSIGFLFNFISYILPFLDGALAGNVSQPSGLALATIHPFSISLVIANIVYPYLLNPNNSGSGSIPSVLPAILAYSAFLGYVIFAYAAGKRMFRSVTSIARGGGVKLVRLLSKDYSLKVRRPIGAYIMKDLRLASKNPSLAFLYAMPIFVVIAIAVVTSQFPVMSTTAMMVSTMVGGSFTVLVCSTLLNTEGEAGTEYSHSLPLKQRTVIEAKSLVASLTFVPVPLALLAVGLSKHLTSMYSILIPFIELVAMGAACMAEVAFFIHARRKKHEIIKASGYSMLSGSEMIRLMQSIAISFTLLLIPGVGYVLAYIQTLNHLSSITVMMILATIELASVIAIARRVTS